MCPLSAMMQFFTIVVGLLLLCHHVVAQAQWEWSLSPAEPELIMYDSKVIQFNLTGPNIGQSELFLMLKTNNEEVTTPREKKIILINEKHTSWFSSSNFSLNGNFLGRAEVVLEVITRTSNKVETARTMNVKVIREKRVIDTVFTSTVATLVSIIYINFGCALNWGELRTSLKRPIGPAIGFVGQFVIMPLLSFGIGKLLFPDNHEMQLGMFFTGVSPGGGASNVWVAVLNGNIDLSITMTAISTFAAFGMMPLWIFSLGRVIFEQGNLGVPYEQISTYAIALVVPLLIGYLIQRFLKKIANFFVRILKVFASLLILFIIIFAIVSNLYLFEIFSWQIVIAGMGLPWLGYMLAFLLAKLGKQSSKDALTIAVETGIQNTGIAIFLLRFALPQPEADLTTVVPVYVAMMTPIPLLVLFLYQKIQARFSPQKEKTYLLSGNTTTNEVDLDNNTQDPKATDRSITTIS